MSCVNLTRFHVLFRFRLRFCFCFSFPSVSNSFSVSDSVSDSAVYTYACTTVALFGTARAKPPLGRQPALPGANLGSLSAKYWYAVTLARNAFPI